MQHPNKRKHFFIAAILLIVCFFPGGGRGPGTIDYLWKNYEGGGTKEEPEAGNVSTCSVIRQVALQCR